MDAKPGQKVGLTCKVEENMEGILMCSLREGGCESQVGLQCALSKVNLGRQLQL